MPSIDKNNTNNENINPELDNWFADYSNSLPQKKLYEAQLEQIPLEPTAGIEPATCSLRVSCSTI